MTKKTVTKAPAKPRKPVTSRTSATQEESGGKGYTPRFTIGRRNWRTRRLDSPQALRTTLAAVFNQVASGEMLPELGSKLGALGQVILSCLRAEELAVLEGRIRELEQRLTSAEQ